MKDVGNWSIELKNFPFLVLTMNVELRLVINHKKKVKDGQVLLFLCAPHNSLIMINCRHKILFLDS